MLCKAFDLFTKREADYRARKGLSLSLCLYVFTIEIYGFMHSLRTFLACTTHGAIATEDWEDRRQPQAGEQVQ